MTNSKFFLSCCLTLLLTAWSLKAWSQNIDLKAGIYTSFFSFQNQRPVPGLSIELQGDDHWKESWVSKNDVKIVSPHKLKGKEMKNIKEMMWGFFDGQDLYISSVNFPTVTYHTLPYPHKTYGGPSNPSAFAGNQNRTSPLGIFPIFPRSARKNNLMGDRTVLFSKVEFLGLRYSYFEEKNELSESLEHYIAEEFLLVRSYFVLNMENGIIFPMDKQTVEELLEEDPELYSRYLEDKKDTENQLYYIQEFNRRNSD